MWFLSLHSSQSIKRKKVIKARRTHPPLIMKDKDSIDLFPNMDLEES